MNEEVQMSINACSMFKFTIIQEMQMSIPNTALTDQVSKTILWYIYFWQDGWKEALSYFLSFNNTFWVLWKNNLILPLKNIHEFINKSSNLEHWYKIFVKSTLKGISMALWLVAETTSSDLNFYQHVRLESSMI